MNTTKNEANRYRRAAVLGIGILAVLLLLSCPNPIDETLANQVEDEFAPLITIITPDPALKYYYPSEILVEGTVRDFTDHVGGTAGTIASLTYEEQFDKRIQGVIDVAADGSFSFTIDALLLEGTQYIVVSAVDWNENVTETVLTAYDKTTGPPIGADIDYTDYTSNPALGKTYTITGVVGSAVGFLTVTYNVEPEFGADIVNQPINPVAGAFSFDFNPSAEGVSGELKFILYATDNDGTNTYTFYLYDDPDPPAYDAACAVAADNTYVDLIFDEGIYHSGGTAPLTTDFTLGWGAGSGTVTDVVLGGFIGTPAAGDTSVRLALNVTGTPAGDETLTVTGSNLTDMVGNPLSPASVNRTLTDKIAPVVMQVGVQTGYENDAYNHLDPTLPIPIIVTFDGPVTVTPPLSLALNSGAAVSYSGGSGTSALTFNYTVTDGDNTPPATALNYTGTGALTGSVTDGGGNTVVNPALPDPAGLNALGVENITIDTSVPADPTIWVDDADMSITKQENIAGVPFELRNCEPGTTYTVVLTNCYLLGGSPSASGTVPPAGTVTGFKLQTSLGTGTATITATLNDEAENESSPVASNLTIATIAPNPPEFNTTSGGRNSLPLVWSWDSGGGVGAEGHYRYKVNDSDLTTGALEQTDNNDPVTYSYTPPADGSYTLYVQEENTWGNWSETSSCELILDRVNPVLNNVPVSISVPTKQGDYEGTSKDDPAIAAFLSAATATDDRDPAPALTVTVGGSAPPAVFPVGETTVRFTATDWAGNSVYQERTVTVENTVIIPNGGEVWKPGTSHTIRWGHDHAGSVVTIELLKGGAAVATLATNTGDDGSYNWSIPSGQTLGGDYRIRVTTNVTPTLVDTSDADFIIENIAVTAPDGGPTWEAGTTKTITWTSSNAGTVKIDLYDGSSLDSTITASAANNGSYSWVIPGGTTPDSGYEIRITSNADAAFFDESPGFVIEKITVTAPTSSVTWTAGDSHDVTWTSSGDGNVTLALYQGGAYVKDIKTTSNDGSTDWGVGAAETTGDYTIRVISDKDNTIYGETGTITIVAP